MREYLVLVCGCAALCLAACGDDDSQQNNNNVIVDSSVQQDVSQIPDGQVTDGQVTQQDGSAGNGMTGDPCTSPTDCGGITNGTPACVTSLFSLLNFPGGYCSSQSCTPGQPCDSGTGICVDPTGMGYVVGCLKVCQSPTECRTNEGYDCTTIPYSSNPTTYCLPPVDVPDGGFSLPDGGFSLPDGGFSLPDGSFP